MGHYVSHRHGFLAVNKVLLCVQNCQIDICQYFITLWQLLLSSLPQEQIGIQGPTIKNIGRAFYYFTELNFIIRYYVYHRHVFIAVNKGLLCDQISQIYLWLYFITLCKLLYAVYVKNKLEFRNQTLQNIGLGLSSFHCDKLYYWTLCIS